MVELSISYNPKQHVLDLPQELSMGSFAVFVEGQGQRSALDVLQLDYKERLGSDFKDFLGRIYRDLRDPSYTRIHEVLKPKPTINQSVAELIRDTRLVLKDIPQESKWAYILTLSRGWTALDLVLGTHRNISYQDKRRTYLMRPNPYPALVSKFEQPELRLGGFEAEVLADICFSADPRELEAIFENAANLVAAIPQTLLGQRKSKPSGLGRDFIERVLSIRYTDLRGRSTQNAG